jgi:hypothetical protein
MNFSTKKYKPTINRLGHILAILPKALGIARRLIEFFKLTEEERLMAGIYRGGEGRDA